MHSHSKSGYSSVSAKEALKAAVEKIIELNGMHHDMYISVKSVKKIDNGYEVDIRASTFDDNDKENILSAARDTNDPSLLSLTYGWDMDKIEELISDEQNHKRLLHDAEIDFNIATHAYDIPRVKDGDLPEIYDVLGHKHFHSRWKHKKYEP